MSHFIVGVVSLAANAGRVEARDLILKSACDYFLTARFLLHDDNLQCEILMAAGLLQNERAIYFELVGRSNTADELISPYLLVDQWPNSIRGTLEAMSDFINKLLDAGSVKEVSIVFSEGFDTDYAICELACDSFVKVLLNKFEEAGEIPSLRIVVRSPSNNL